MQIKSENWRDIGLLILRLGVGAMFMVHGVPKIMGGSQLWAKLGTAMGNFGIGFWPTVWGFLAAISEGGGGLLMVTGLFFRPAMALMFITMMVATTHHLAGGDGIQIASHAIEAGTVFLSLIFIGPGKYTLMRLLKRRENEKLP
jgi:putative oxidoreductase